MKKSGVVLVLFLLFIMPLILQITLVKAQEENIPGMPSALNPDNAEQNLENLKNKTLSSSEYIKQEWDKIIKNNPFLSAIFKVLNPILKTFIGYEFSMEVAFFVALVTSLVVFAFVFEGTNSFWGEQLGALAISLLFMIILAASGFQRMIVPKIMIVLDNVWKIISFIVIGLLLIVLMDYVKKTIKKRKKEKALENLPKTERKINRASNKLEGVMKGMENVRKGAETFRGGEGI